MSVTILKAINEPSNVLVTVTEDGIQYYEYVFDNVKSVELNIKRNIIDVTLPGQDEPEIMTIGGVDFYYSFVFVVVSDDINLEIKKLLGMFGTGQVSERFKLIVDEWNVNIDCVIEDVRIRQLEAEPNKIEVEIHLVGGFIIS